MASSHTPPASQTQRERLHQIDGLRAAACLMVVAAHCLTKPVCDLIASRGAEDVARFIARIPASGVEFFFVLSGVVLLRPYLRGEKAFDAWRYASRRFLRIYPPYWACLLASVPLVIFAGRFPTWYSAELIPPFRWQDVWAQVPLVVEHPVSYNAAWWSLAIEVLFYAFVPVVVWFGQGTPFRPWLAVAMGCGLTLASLWCHAIVPLPVREVVPVSTSICRFAICFFMGIVIAKTDLAPAVAAVLMAAGLVVVALVPARTGSEATAGFALFYGGLVATVLRPGVLQRFFSQPLAIWIGERSYSIFLIHFTIFYLTNYALSFVVPSRNMTYFLASRLIGLPLALLAAMLLFHLVERRFAHGLVTADCFWPGSYLARQRQARATVAPARGGAEAPVA
jgi:peptidoglycan/LPS O-acetylase OafA/YrhL